MSEPVSEEFETTLKLACKNPEAVKASLEPDIKNDETSHTEITAKADGKSVEIKVRSKKLSHMKAIVNSYISAVQMLNEVDEKNINHKQ